MRSWSIRDLNLGVRMGSFPFYIFAPPILVSAWVSMVICSGLDNLVQIPGKKKDVCIGGNGVFGLAINDPVMYWNSSIGSWIHVSGTLHKLSCSIHRIWGVNSGSGMYVRKELSESHPMGEIWTGMGGGFLSAAVNRDGNSVWAIRGTGEVQRRTGISPTTPEGTDWETIPSPSCVQITSGRRGVFCVTDTQDHFYWEGTENKPESAGTAWTQYSGKFARVQSCFDNFIAIDPNGDTYMGKTSAHLVIQTPKNMEVIDCDERGHYVGLDKEGNVYVTPECGSFEPRGHFSIRNEALLVPQFYAGSEEECATRCLRNPRCYSWAFKENQCLVAGYQTDAGSFVQDSSWVSYDIENE